MHSYYYYYCIFFLCDNFTTIEKTICNYFQLQHILHDKDKEPKTEEMYIRYIHTYNIGI